MEFLAWFSAMSWLVAACARSERVCEAEFWTTTVGRWVEDSRDEEDASSRVEGGTLTAGEREKGEHYALVRLATFVALDAATLRKCCKFIK